MVEGELVQRIEPAPDFTVSYREAATAEITDIMKEFIQPFDLSRVPLLRVGLVKTGTENYLMLIDMHRIISDGRPIDILMNEFARL